MEIFGAHVDATLVQQIFEIPKREREADDLGTRFKVFEKVGSGRGKSCATAMPRFTKVLLTKPLDKGWYSLLLHRVFRSLPQYQARCSSRVLRRRDTILQPQQNSVRNLFSKLRDAAMYCRQSWPAF